jgi:hypothetical protein
LRIRPAFQQRCLLAVDHETRRTADHEHGAVEGDAHALVMKYDVGPVVGAAARPHRGEIRDDRLGKAKQLNYLID